MLVTKYWIYFIGVLTSLALVDSFKPTLYSINKQFDMVATRSSLRGSVRPTTALSSSKQGMNESKQKTLAVPVTPSPKKKRKSASSASKQEVKGSKQKALVTPVTPSPKKKRKPLFSPPVDAEILTSDDVAAINPSQPYIDLGVPPEELRPSATLTTGQCFHWKAVLQQDMQEHQSAWGSPNATEWVGTIRSPTTSVVVAIRETPTTTLYRPLTKTTCDLQQVLCKYFQLQHSLKDLYQAWSKADSRLATIAKCIPGVRIVDQDPWECLVSFICSSNNNIPRIAKMLSAIRKEYGTALVTIGNQTFYSFPSCEELAASATDEDFRKNCGLGYRSKYIMETIRILQDYGGEPYLQELRELDDTDLVQEKLCEFCGVGRKVADCVALFSLQQDSAIPVDVHVWNIARRDYDSEGVLKAVKSLTPSVYKQIGDLFRVRFPEKAGWAHSLLFVAELPSFRPTLPEKLIREMNQFREEEQLRKQEAKASKQSKKEK
jgi:N-glycosylase/DNA lyase